MWQIDKTIDFCYSHRVWTQSLNVEYSHDISCKCKHIHGHQGKLQVFLEKRRLNSSGMVTDFKHLNWLKVFVDTYIDHKFIIDINDPYLPNLLEPLTPIIYEPVTIPNTEMVAMHVINLNHLISNTSNFEIAEGLSFVQFVPTSENLAKWFFEIASVKMSKLGVKVARVDFWETPKSRSSYSE